MRVTATDVRNLRKLVNCTVCEFCKIVDIKPTTYRNYEVRGTSRSLFAHMVTLVRMFKNATSPIPGELVEKIRQQMCMTRTGFANLVGSTRDEIYAIEREHREVPADLAYAINEKCF